MQEDIEIFPCEGCSERMIKNKHFNGTEIDLKLDDIKAIQKTSFFSFNYENHSAYISAILMMHSTIFSMDSTGMYSYLP